MWTKENMPNQNDRTVIVTGANTGVGYETALAFYEKGSHVVLACRSLEKANEAISKMKTTRGSGTLEAAQLDLANLAAIKQFAESLLQTHPQLHMLINNAGVMVPPASTTDDGWELQFGVNFLGHFALTGYLYPLLKNTAGARIITVSSMAYLRGSINFNNLHSEQSYDATREYAQSKLANILFAVELDRRIAQLGDNVLSVAAQPGANNTDLSRHMSKEGFSAAVERVGTLMEPWQGALPTLYAATMKDVKGGELYSPDQDGGYRGYPTRFDITPSGLDEAVAKKLWQLAEEATGVLYPL
jgi:NAD(P)-dependent dehydrogenase (short-subunit alcohol dehydrogenase family)